MSLNYYKTETEKGLPLEGMGPCRCRYSLAPC
jgi:hypothetical protein